MTVVAHGGTGGAIVEVAGLVVLAALLVAVWLNARRQRDDERGGASPDEQL